MNAFKKSRDVIFFITFILLILAVNNVMAGREIDNRLYAELLGRYVEDGVVDYKGFKNEEIKLDRYLEILEDVDPGSLSRAEEFAFYVNAYNAWTIKLILENYPGVESIKDLGSLFRSPWEKRICRIDGKILTLDQIEHDIIRPRFRDPRTHFAVNCASKGCPPLRSEPYYGFKLDRQLDEMARAFINDRARNRIEGNTLWISKIFSWYSEDFNNDIIDYFLKYAEGDLKRLLNENRKNIDIDYLEYDWSLNGK